MLPYTDMNETVSHINFSKSFYCDLDMVELEAKTVIRIL
jgi:hypothetical protein